MRNLTSEEFQIIAGANQDAPVTLREATGLLGAELGSRFGPGGTVIGGITGLAAGHVIDKYGREFFTPPQTTFPLPMHGTPPNHRYGGGFS